MKPPPFVPRSSFAIHIPQTGETGHWFVILTDTCDEGCNLIVPVCSIRGVYDNSCVLGPGDHDFVKKPSYIAYRHLDVLPSKEIEEKVHSKVFSKKDPFEQRVFERICAGVEISDDAALKHQKYFRNQIAIMRAKKV